MDDSQSLHLVNKDSNRNRVTEMTKEDVQEPASEGDTLLNGQRSVSLDLERPVVHQVASAPMPADSEFSFFDPNDPKCQEILFDPDTTISELFAVLRQWVPQVQQNISVIGNEILKRGCQVNDRDGLTDMTLLHYTCKAGAPGIGDAGTAASFASQLISMGADPNLRSRWTNMNALHYAAYFDVPELICVVLKSSRTGEVNATCSDFDFGTALHISASNLCLSAVKCLLEHGANPAFRNDRGLIAADVVPDPLEMPLDMAEAAALAKELRKVLLDALPLSCDISKTILPNYDYISGKTLLRSLGINLGDRVIIAGQKVGTLRFCGATEFAGGQWAGVELDEPEGKNNGAVGGIRYFRCPPNHGIFAPLSKITRVSDRKETLMKCSTPKGSMPVRVPKIDLSHVTSKVNSEGSASIPFSSCSSSSTSSLDVKVPMNSKQKQTNPRLQNVSRTRRSMPALLRSTGGQRIFSMGSVLSEESNIQVGDRVLVAGQRIGVVRFHGKTSFAPGFWYGVELDKPSGKNDGSVGTVRYFNCPPKHGVFAPPSRVQRVHGSLDSLTDISSRLSHSFPGMRRSYSTSSGISSQRELTKRTAVSSLDLVSRSRPAVLFRSWSTTSTSGSLSQTPDRGVKLHQGMQILLLSSNEMATIRYIGPTDFAPGLWLGLELRSPKGKNDGSVGDRRYFSCRPNYGVLVRPSRIAYRGINGAKLVDDCN
ncbi:CAP-Gly domain-containing linker protein 4-like isoform X5 [Polypterus senegalus]|uniref:CAP-Gly domain-containing linker protein 4-like isoform X5 n=1 Tax=Polypterus senegalus TaxID=55291 RepID=UPI001963F29F|nr:CAP-Gly domain-containing linker protein 4-like isoform X5 [Polypterus senegalus]